MAIAQSTEVLSTVRIDQGISKVVMDDNDIRASILRYLSANPDAEDTLHAITYWWIMRDRCELRAMQVKDVTDKLASEGLLIEKHSEMRGLVYALNKDRLADIEAIVAG